MRRRGGRRGLQGHRVRGWGRWVNLGDFEQVNGLPFVFLASSFRLYARGEGRVLTIGGESGMGRSVLAVGFQLSAEKIFWTESLISRYEIVERTLQSRVFADGSVTCAG